MGRNTFTYIHGDTGAEPAVAKDFQKNDRPQANNFDWFWYHTIEAVKAHASEFDRLDGDNDGIVDEADTLTAGGNLKGDLLAVDDEKVWNEAGGYVPQAQLQRDTVTVSTGTDLTGGGDVSLGGSLTITHEDTSTQSNVSAGSGEAVTDVDLDGNGHVTSISTTPIAISDTHTSVSEDGTQTVGSVDDINFQGHLNVIDDGDGTVSLDPTHNHDSRYYTESEMDTKLGNQLTASNYTPEADTHSRYSDSEARTAVEGTSSITDLNGANSPVQLKVYSSTSNLPSGSQGEIAYVSGEGLYVFN
jgi:hypothetical protein